MPLSGAKDEHFSCFYSSCQLGLTQENEKIKNCELPAKKHSQSSQKLFGLEFLLKHFSMTETDVGKIVNCQLCALNEKWWDQLMSKWRRLWICEQENGE